MSLYSNSDITLKPIEPRDCSALAQLYLQSFSAVEAAGTVFLSPKFDCYLAQLVAFPYWQNPHWLWGAWKNGQLVGGAQARETVSSWHLSYLAVAPEFQNRGIGRLLWKAWLEEGRTRNQHRFALDVEEGNARARAWYERMGYRVAETTWFGCRDLASTPTLPSAEHQLLNWENAQAWQECYGFSQFEIAQNDNKWVIGRLGNEYFRVRETVPVEIEIMLRQLDAARSLLVLSPQPITGLSQIKRTLLMTHQID
jgi:ribosomal protein S18 acetylase RimI-like enzyme